jgi:hypothetical protein
LSRAIPLLFLRAFVVYDRVKRTDHKAPRYVVFSVTLLLCPLQIQISSSAPYSGAPSIFVDKISPSPRPCEVFRNTGTFYSEELLAPRPTRKLEGRPLSVAHDCLFNIFAATLHIGGRSSIRILSERHAVVTATNLSRHNLKCMEY